MKNQTPKYKSRSNLDKKVASLLKKFEPRHSSERQLFSSLDPKIANGELIITKKFKNSKKIVVSPYKQAMLLPSTEFILPKPSSASPIKIHRTPKTSLSPLKVSQLQLPESPTKPPITGNRLYTLQRLSGSPIMKSYDKLIRSCSTILPTKDFIFQQEQKRIRKLKKNIKTITDDPEENLE